jgi:hypothetical protein
VWRAADTRRSRVTGGLLPDDDGREVFYDPVIFDPDTDLRRLGAAVLVSRTLLLATELGRFEAPPDLQ